jgi:hypothetical protein
MMAGGLPVSFHFHLRNINRVSLKFGMDLIKYLFHVYFNLSVIYCSLFQSFTLFTSIIDLTNVIRPSPVVLFLKLL